MGSLNETASWDASVPYFAADAILTGGPDCPDNIPIQALTNRTAFLKKQIDDAVSGALVTMSAKKLQTARNIAMTGDGTWSVNFDGSGNVTAVMSLATTGIAAGTYPVITVDNKGRATAGRALQSGDLPNSLALTGTPTAPTAQPGTNTDQVATTAFAKALLTAGGFGMTDVGVYIGNLDDVSFAAGFYYFNAAALNSPIPGGQGVVLHKVYGTAGFQLLQSYSNDRLLWRKRSGGVWSQWNELANLASPAFTGIPTVPTATVGTNTTQAASTAFVQAAIAALVAASPAALDTLNELAAALGNDPNFATTMINALAGKASLAGSAAQAFSVLSATQSQHAVNLGQMQGKTGNAGGLTMRNLLINASGNINQRGYVSGTATTIANQYTIDRWKVLVAGQSLTLAQNGAYSIFTAPAGGVSQVVEGLNIFGGNYVLSWAGTAAAAVNGVAVANGGTVNLPANANATVTFSGGTFAIPQLEMGTVKTEFDFRLYGVELALCQRYFAALRGGMGAQCYAASGANMYIYARLPQTMRAAPAISIIGIWNVTNCGQPTASLTTADQVILISLVAGTASTIINAGTSGSSIGFNADADI